MATPYALADTEVLALPQSANGRTYQLDLSVPASAVRHPSRRYPVIYLTDPYWDFPLVYATAGNLLFDQLVPECILAGIGYPGADVNYEKERTEDLAPVPDSHHPPGAGREGGADEFLGVLEREIIPAVERETPADPARRIILGSSLGGLFGIFAMLTRPGLFRATVAVSPAVLWADDWIFGLEERFAQGGGRLRGRLFLSGAADEWPEFLAAVVRFEKRVRERAYPDLAYEWRLIDGARHSGTKAEGFTRGLQFAFGG
jgi:predicted alpha/beta superfamily hydrolase